MQGPVIVADVSKDSSHIQAFKNLNEPFCEPFVIHHKKNELQKIDSLLKELKKETKIKEVSFCFEHTGIFSNSIFKYCSELGLKCFGISPVESAKIRKSHIRVTKTDKLDCANIADVFYLRDLRETLFKNNNFESLMRSRKLFVNDAVRCENSIIHLLDLIWPNYKDLFELYTNETSLLFIEHYKHPCNLSNKSKNEILNVVQKLPWIRNKIDFTEKVFIYSRNVYSGVDKDDDSVSSLLFAIKNYKNILKAIKDIDKKAIDISKDQEDFKLYKTIPGVADILALRLKYCIGDICRFSSKKKLCAYAGIDPSILASGKNKGLHLSITRKGNAYLRSTLYLIFSNMLMHHSNNQIVTFFRNKKSSGLPHKVAAVAACHKLLSCIFGMLVNNTSFKTY